MSSIVYLVVAVAAACCVGAVRGALLGGRFPLRAANGPGPISDEPTRRARADLPQAA